MNSFALGLDRLVGLTRQLSRLASRLIGICLLLVVFFVLIEITMRKLGVGSLPGVHEYSGYALAFLSSWGLAHTLIERAHIRIDLGYSRLPPAARCALDLLAIFTLNLVSWTIVIHAWPVLEKSLANGSMANTPLSTPLWIPQLIWAAGYAWFAFTTSVLALRSILAAIMGRADVIEHLIGMGSGESMEASNNAQSTSNEVNR